MSNNDTNPLTLVTIITALGATGLIASEFVVIALALDWSVTGLLGYSTGVTEVVAVVMAPFLAYACWWTFRRTLRVERLLSAGSDDY